MSTVRSIPPCALSAPGVYHADISRLETATPVQDFFLGRGALGQSGAAPGVQPVSQRAERAAVVGGKVVQAATPQHFEVSRPFEGLSSATCSYTVPCYSTALYIERNDHGLNHDGEEQLLEQQQLQYWPYVSRV